MHAFVSVDHFFRVGLLLHPPISDDWKWSTDKGAFIIKCLLKKAILTAIPNREVQGFTGKSL